jgi:hypothetical protein
MLAAIITPDTSRVAVIVKDDKVILATIDEHGFVDQNVLLIEPREPIPLTIVEGCTLEVQIATYL